MTDKLDSLLTLSSSSSIEGSFSFLDNSVKEEVLTMMDAMQNEVEMLYNWEELSKDPNFEEMLVGKNRRQESVEYLGVC